MRNALFFLITGLICLPSFAADKYCGKIVWSGFDYRFLINFAYGSSAETSPSKWRIESLLAPSPYGRASSIDEDSNFSCSKDEYSIITCEGSINGAYPLTQDISGPVDFGKFDVKIHVVDKKANVRLTPQNTNSQFKFNEEVEVGTGWNELSLEELACE